MNSNTNSKNNLPERDTNTTADVYRFRVIESYLSKVADFNQPHLHLAPQLGVMLVEFCQNLCHQRNRIPRLHIANQCTKFEVSGLSRSKDVTWPRPFQGQFVVRRLGLAMINMHTKFQVSVFTRNEDIVTVSYLSKVAYFNLPHLHIVPPLGVTPFKFCRDLWH